MMFITIALAVTVGSLLAGGIALLIMMQPKVMKSYMKWVHKTTNEIMEEIFEEKSEDL